MDIRSTVVFAALAVTFCLPLAAANAPLAFAEIRQQQVELRNDLMADAEPYRAMTKRDRRRLLEAQDRLLQLIEDQDTLLDLDEASRTEAINSLELIRAVVHDTEQDQLICNREQVVGTRMFTRVCRTVAEMRKDRDDAGRALSKGSPGCAKPGGCR